MTKLLRVEFFMVIVLSLPMVLINEPFEKLYFTFRLVMDRELFVVPESKRISDESLLSPIHDKLMTSRLLIYIFL